MNSRLWEQKIEKHDIQKIDCDGQPKSDEKWMSAETSSVHDNARGQRDMV